MTTYELVEVLSEGVIGLKSEFGHQMFTRRTLRKANTCADADCGRHLEPGEQAWGEATSAAMNRMHRICHPCVLLMLRTAANDASQNRETPDAPVAKTPKKTRGTRRAMPKR